MKITVGATATLLAAADADRDTLFVQHVDVSHADVKIWLGGAAVTAGDGCLLMQLGEAIAIQGSAARGAWYGIAASNVDAVVVRSSRWDSRAA